VSLRLYIFTSLQGNLGVYSGECGHTTAMETKTSSGAVKQGAGIVDASFHMYTSAMLGE
jgi:hypothetical protein